MDDRQIERRLRQAFPAEPPEGLRGRVLLAARQRRLEAARKEQAGRLRWAGAFLAAVLWIALATSLDSSREARLQAMALRGAPPGITIARAVQQIQQEQAQVYRGGLL